MLKRHEQDLLDRVQSGLGIGGQWESSGSAETIDVRDPATGEVTKSIADATVEDAVRALDAAVATQDMWANTPTRERSDILSRALDLLMERKEDFALLVSMEIGKPIAEARSEVDYGGEFLRWFSEEAVRVRGDYRPNPEGTGTVVVSHIPVGPKYFITPWNFPLAMATRKVAPALAAGCAPTPTSSSSACANASPPCRSAEEPKKAMTSARSSTPMRSRIFLPADRHRPAQPAGRDDARRNFWTGSRDNPLFHRGRGGRDREQHRVRSRELRIYREYSPQSSNNHQARDRNDGPEHGYLIERRGSVRKNQEIRNRPRGRLRGIHEFLSTKYTLLPR